LVIIQIFEIASILHTGVLLVTNVVASIDIIRYIVTIIQIHEALIQAVGGVIDGACVV